MSENVIEYGLAGRTVLGIVETGKSYRTVSVTSCLGKRFELIVSQRLMTFLDSINFDIDQFAYLRRRSTTHALITVVEKGLLTGKKAGVLFFDFSDAFGSVNRFRLLV